MAKIFPAKFPAHKASLSKFWAEKTVYEVLSSLSDDYLIIYSASWLGAGRNGAGRDCEIDFLICHPQKGILVLEVKGGRIGYDASSDQFTSTSNEHGVVDIKDPYEQAKTNKYLLLNLLQSKPLWPKAKIPLCHGVVFPSSTKVVGYSSASHPVEITCFAEDLKNIAPKIEEIFAFWHTDDPSAMTPPGPTGLQVVKDLFARDYTHRIPLVSQLESAKERIIQLSEEQFSILDLLGGHRRAIVDGGAGTGKTVLAMEKARQLAAAGFRTLLLCYNRALGDYLVEFASRVDGLEAGTFHKHALAIARKAGLLNQNQVPDNDIFYSEILPELMLQALDKIEDRYDAIVVDEGQDFRPQWWTPIQFALSDPDAGVLYIFRDEFQNITHEEKNTYPVQTPPFVLKRNLRNSKQIFDYAKAFLPDGVEIQPAGPPAADVYIVRLKNPEKELLDQISKTLHKIVVDGKVSLSDVVILTGSNQKQSLLGSAKKAGNFHLSFGTPRPNHAYVETVRRFKGLERTAVILVETEQIRSNKALMYVALTRAKLHLTIIE